MSLMAVSSVRSLLLWAAISESISRVSLVKAIPSSSGTLCRIFDALSDISSPVVESGPAYIIPFTTTTAVTIVAIEANIVRTSLKNR